MEAVTYDPRLSTSLRMTVVGPSMSGKTILMTKMLNYHRQVFDPPFDIAYWVYPTDTAKPKELDTDIPVHFTESLPIIDDMDPDLSKILILDDMVSGKEVDDYVMRLFTVFSHHSNLTVIRSQHNLFQKDKHSRTIALNTQHLALFNSPRDVLQVNRLGQQMYPRSGHFLEAAYIDAATKQPFSYLFLSFSPRTPQALRVRGNIIPADGPLTVYLPRGQK